MTSVADIERAASRLRQQLRSAGTPELRLLCGLQFFGMLSQDTPALESYVREFLPALGSAAGKSNHRELLPSEIDSLRRYLDLLASQSDDAVARDDFRAIERLAEAFGQRPPATTETRPAAKGRADVRCLFVEHYPDLGLSPRGRILNLTVTVTPISARFDSDDIVVRNPVSEPDDRFLAQARDSVSAARAHLQKHYGLSPRKRYRFDFAVDSTGARFTGDSLGAAFAAGAVAAVTRHEVFRERLHISPSAALSGALSSDGTLGRIDPEALKLKIYRAFHSDLQVLVIPREHINDAWAYLTDLEQESPGRKLELLGADSLDDIIADPRLLPVERFSAPAHIARLAWKAKRSVWVELPVALLLIAILVNLPVIERHMPWFDDNPAFANVKSGSPALEVFNADSVLLWSKDVSCNMEAKDASGYVKVADLDHDSLREVVYTPFTFTDCESRSILFCFESDGSVRFTDTCSIIGEYPGDSLGTQYEALGVWVTEVAGRSIILSAVCQSSPARSHWRAWDSQGNRLGWYINAGCGDFRLARDLNGEGKETLLFLGFNNRMGCVGLAAIDIDSMYGVSPPYDDPNWELSTVKRGRQRAYVLFPMTDVCRESGDVEYNQPHRVAIREHTTNWFDVVTLEAGRAEENLTVAYSLDNSSLRVQSVLASDQYLKRRSDLVISGDLPVVDMAQYLDSLQRSVLYWTGESWLSEGQLRDGADPTH